MTAAERMALTREMLAHHRNATVLEGMSAQLRAFGSGLVIARMTLEREARWQRLEADRCKRELGLGRARMPEVIDAARRVVSSLEG